MKTIILVGLCAALGAGFVSIRAEDNPAQTAARAALNQKLNELNGLQNQSSPTSGTLSGTAVTQPAQSATSATGTVSVKAVTAQTTSAPTVPATTPATSQTTTLATPPATTPATIPTATPVTVSAAAPAKNAPATAVKESETGSVGSGVATGHRPKMDSSMISILLAASAPFLVLLAAITWNRYQRSRVEKPPQTEKQLRPRSYSPSSPPGQTADQIEKDILVACASFAVAVICAVVAGWWLPQPLSAFVSACFVAAFACLGVFLMLRAMRRFRETQNTRPRIRNKPAVAETLNKTAGNGFHPVQDLPVEDNKALILSPSGPKRKRRQLA